MLTQKFIIETAIFLAFAIPLSIMDSRKFRISLPYTFAGILCFLAYRILFSSPDEFEISRILNVLQVCAVSAATSALVFFIARVFSGNGLGKGDIIYGIFTALYSLFYVNLVGIAFAALLGILFYLFLAVLDRIRKNQKVLRPIFAIPFIPFISAGAILARIFFG